MTQYVVAILALALVQTGPDAAPPAFDAAFIKPVDIPPGIPGMRGGGSPMIPRFLMHGRLEFSTGKLSGRNVTVRQMILDAYRLPETQLEGGPDWLDADQFDIEAKAEGPANDLQLRAMLQTLLAERFKLVTHRESREMHVDALMVKKSGPKMPAWQEGQIMPMPDMDKKSGVVEYLAHGTMQQFAEELSHEPRTYRPVVDRTGLSGVYLMHMEWEQGGSVFSSLRQLGLELRSQKAAVDVLIVDSVEGPAEN